MEFTKKEKTLRTVMFLYGITFVIADLVFIFASPILFDLLNQIGNLFNLPPSPPFQNRFYLDLTNSMMVMIAYISFAVYYNPRENFSYMKILILSKYTSSTFGILFFIFTERYFSYLTILLTDLPLAIIAHYLYKWVKKEQK